MEKHMQEYPKALYRNGECAHANNQAEEEALCAAGFTDWRSDHERTHGGGDAVAGNFGEEADTSAADEAKAQLQEWEMRLLAKEGELTAKEQELAARESALAAKEADLAAQLAASANVIGAGDEGGSEPLDRDALKATAKELGIEHAPNITTEKLAALVATTVASANPT